MKFLPKSDIIDTIVAIVYVGIVNLVLASIGGIRSVFIFNLVLAYVRITCFDKSGHRRRFVVEFCRIFRELDRILGPLIVSLTNIVVLVVVGFFIIKGLLALFNLALASHYAFAIALALLPGAAACSSRLKARGNLVGSA